MRLIDAYELIKDLNEQIPLAENVSIFNDIIESQPTAYDVDKVVEQILNVTVNLFCDGNRNGGKTLYATTLEEYRRTIINIVKEGGVNEQKTMQKRE